MTQKMIDPQMTISEILSGFPQYTQKLAQEITNAGLHCVGCGAAHVETLEAGMLGHGRTRDQINDLVKKLNAILSEKVDTTTISLTPSAAEQFLFFCEQEGKVGYGLRFGEQLAGCSGFEYILDFSEKATPDDEIFHSQGIEIHVERALLKRLLGCTIDYIKGLNNSGFKVINPNVNSSCGCGSSHGY